MISETSIGKDVEKRPCPTLGVSPGISLKDWGRPQFSYRSSSRGMNSVPLKYGHAELEWTMCTWVTLFITGVSSGKC